MPIRYSLHLSLRSVEIENVTFSINKPHALGYLILKTIHAELWKQKKFANAKYSVLLSCECHTCDDFINDCSRVFNMLEKQKWEPLIAWNNFTTLLISSVSAKVKHYREWNMICFMSHYCICLTMNTTMHNLVTKIARIDTISVTLSISIVGYK